MSGGDAITLGMEANAMSEDQATRPRRRRGRTVAIVIIAVLAILGGGVLVAPSLIDWNSFKPQVAAAVRDATGKDLRIDGDINVSLLPRATLSVEGIRLLDPEGAAGSELLTVERISGAARVWPLLARRLVVDELVIAEPMLTLVVDPDGRQNWALPATEPDVAAPPAETSEDGGLIRDVSFTDVRIAGGRIAYEDRRTGQSYQADDIIVTAALPEPGNAATVAGEMRLNDEPATVSLSGQAPDGVLAGARMGIEALLESRLLRAHYAGNLQNQPSPAADGAVEIDTESIAALADWLGAPLPELQPDPGPLMLRARFAADSSIVDVQELVIQGDGVDASVNASFAQGAAPTLQFNMQSGLVDVDHYLTLAQADRPAAAPAPEGVAEPVDLLALIPDTPIDLSPFQAANATINVQLEGVRAAGFEVGPIDMAVELLSGVATANITEIGLYDGGVRGQVVLDGSTGETLALSTDLSFDNVAVDQLATTALVEAPVAGVASGTLAATAQGASPRDLIASAVGEIALALNDPVVPAAPAPVGDILLAINLPGPAQSPEITAELAYNGEPATVSLRLDALDQILAGEDFAVTASVNSRLAEVNYDGRVALAPALAADGAFALNITSVAELAGWLDIALDGLVDEPGAVSVTTRINVDPSRPAAEFADLAVETAFADLRGSGSFDGQGSVPQLSLDLVSERIALQDLLAPAAEQPTAEPSPDTTEAADGAPLTLPDTPLDLAALQQADADVRVRVGALSTETVSAGPIDLALALDGGIATVTVAEVGFGGGTLRGGGMLDSASASPMVAAEFTLDGLAVDTLIADAPLAGLANGSLEIASEGASVQALVANLVGKADFSLADVDVRDQRVGSVADVALALDLPGPTSAPRVEAAATYNSEPITVAVTLDPLAKITAGDPLTVAATVGSRLMNAQYDGVLSLAPALGVRGQLGLDITSVTELGEWLGQPLEQLPDDPGPLAINARFAADAAALTFDLDEFSIEGEGLDARAVGRVDASGPVPNITLDVEGGTIDLDRFLPAPPAAESTAEPSEDVSALPEDAGWSDAPFDLAGLRKFEGQAHVSVTALSFRDIDVRNSAVDVTLSDAVLSGEVASGIAGGTMTGALTVDATEDAAAFRYQASANGVQARPVLRSVGATDRLSGAATLTAEGAARGRSQRELFESLNGTGAVRFVDGAIHGINLAALLRQARSLGLESSAGAAQQTDFAELAGSFDITDGVLSNRDLTMLAPLVRLSGAGVVSLPPQTLDYGLEAKLVASLEGQGGDTALAGLPIPVSIAGPWSQPTYGVDWENVFQAVAQDPARLANLPDELRAIGTGLGVALPIPETEGLGAIVETVLGGASGASAEGSDKPPTPAEGAVSILQQLIAPEKQPSEAGAEQALRPNRNRSAFYAVCSATSRDPPSKSGPGSPRRRLAQQLYFLLGNTLNLPLTMFGRETAGCAGQPGAPYVAQQKIFSLGNTSENATETAAADRSNHLRGLVSQAPGGCGAGAWRYARPPGTARPQILVHGATACRSYRRALSGAGHRRGASAGRTRPASQREPETTGATTGPVRPHVPRRRPARG